MPITFPNCLKALNICLNQFYVRWTQKIYLSNNTLVSFKCVECGTTVGPNLDRFPIWWKQTCIQHIRHGSYVLALDLVSTKGWKSIFQFRFKTRLPRTKLQNRTKTYRWCSKMFIWFKLRRLLNNINVFKLCWPLNVYVS